MIYFYKENILKQNTNMKSKILKEKFKLLVTNKAAL